MSDLPYLLDADLPALDARSGERPLLLCFSASWCAPCKAMAPMIDDVADHYADRLVTARIDIEQAPDLAARFTVRGVPTLVILSAGEERLRQLGPITKTRLAMMIDDALAEDAA